MTESSRIKVAVRCRPVKESIDGDVNTSKHIAYDEKSIIIKEGVYKFDHIFPSASNEEVYETTIAPNMGELFKGHNLTVLAYGATGSGKTYTMGTHYDLSKGEIDEGIILRSVKNIFKTVDDNDNENTSFAIKVSFIEVYGEDVYDLLKPKSTILPNIKQESDVFKIPNLTEISTNSAEEVFSLLKKGCLARKTAATAKNPKSSRSHGIFTITIEQTNSSSEKTQSKFLLVDLAGSERIDTSQTSGQQMKEGININKGLLTLRNVIKAKSEGKAHIPFRDSKLTKILQESFGGNSHTVMIACIYPMSSNLDETLSTLRYATLARTIVNKPKTSVVPTLEKYESMAKEVVSLKAQVASYQAKLASVASGNFRDVGTLTDPTHVEKVLKKAISEESSEVPQMCPQPESHSPTEHELVPPRKALKRKLPVFSMGAGVSSMRDGSSVQESSKSEDHHGKLMNTTITISQCHDDETIEVFGDLEGSCGQVETESGDLAQLKECTKRMSAIQSKVRMLENEYKDIDHLNEEVMSDLNRHLESCELEKRELEEGMKTKAEENIEMDQLKVVLLKRQIKKLRHDIKGNNKLMQKREINNANIEKLRKENDQLKLLKVNLMKKIKEAGTNLNKLNVEKKREVNKLTKDSRKKENDFLKIKARLEKELSVLKQRVESNNKKKPKKIVTRARPLKSHNKQQVPIETLAKEIVDTVIEKKITGVICKKTEEDIASVLPSLLSVESDAMENLAQKEKEEIAQEIKNAKLYAETIKIESAQDAKKQEAWIDDAIQNFMNHLSMMDAYSGMPLVIKEFLSYVEKMTKEKEDESSEFLKKCDALKHTLDSEREIRDEQIGQLTHDKEEVDKKNAILVQQVEMLKRQLSKKIKSEGGSELQERIKSQEDEITILKQTIETYKAKDTQIQSLSKNLLRAKKGKPTTWLSEVPSTSTAPHDTPISESLMKEFLGDESIVIPDEDAADPDWRATPVYRRKTTTRRVAAAADEEAPPAKKYLFDGCQCPSGCRSMRCKCRRSSLECTDSCSCDKDGCENMGNQ